MPIISWFASFIFLGLSISIGLLIYFLFYRNKKEDQSEELPPELQEQIEKKDGLETIEDLEKKYGKKG